MDAPKDSSIPVPSTDEETGALPTTDGAAPDAQVKKGQEDASLGDMPSIFNTTKPKNICDGLGNGLSNVLKGIMSRSFFLYRMPSHRLFHHTRNTWRSCIDGRST